ncbi:hypothetical protein, partial [Microbacterium sp. NRRL B-14842]|uniref:hypothetical protein n=1 Tax=Microbacterium sp. NRRL B-14842 TaxID=3162881 RepID=UPI003D2851AC
MRSVEPFGRVTSAAVMCAPLLETLDRDLDVLGDVGGLRLDLDGRGIEVDDGAGGDSPVTTTGTSMA